MGLNLLKYQGAKQRLAPKIIELMGYPLKYGEPCGGSAAVLLNKTPSRYEYYNDLDGNLVRFMRVLQSPLKTGKLIRRLSATLYARAELVAAIKAVSDPVDEIDFAWGYYCSSRMQRPGGPGFLVSLSSSHNHKPDAVNFRSAVGMIRECMQRLSNMHIEANDAVSAILQFDEKDMLHYVDPDYPGESGYAHSVDHAKLVDTLNSIKGRYILSSYIECDYSRLEYAHRELIRNRTFNAKKKRTEVLYMNYKPDGLLF